MRKNAHGIRIKVELEGALPEELERATVALWNYFERLDIDPWDAFAAGWELEKWDFYGADYKGTMSLFEVNRLVEALGEAQAVAEMALASSAAAQAGEFVVLELVEGEPDVHPLPAG